MIDAEKELFRWGPIDGRPIYPDFFNQSFVLHGRVWGVEWPDCIGYFEDDRVLFVVEYWKLRDYGEKLFDQYIMDPAVAEKHFKEWEATLGRLRKIEEQVKGLAKFSDDDLAGIWKNLCEWGLDFWVKGLLPEFANWGGEQKLKKLLEGHEAFIELFEKLSTPEDLSFYQREELDLLKIKLARSTEQESLLSAHQKNYYWIKNSYGFTEEKPFEAFKEELDKISPEAAKKRIAAIESYVQKVLEEKEELKIRYKVPDETYTVARSLSFSIWWQDYRKQFIFICNHIVSRILEELGKRKEIPFKALCYYNVPEISRLFETGLPVKNVETRYQGFLCYYHEGEDLSYHEGEEARRIIEPYKEIKIESTDEASGIVVSQGKEKVVRGTARILLTPRDVEMIKESEILLAPMTSPDYVVAMRKASAIVTDEGGMTSHAAIISRELGLPCIVGTRVATKIFKDGDKIKVDTTKGTVRRV